MENQPKPQQENKSKLSLEEINVEIEKIDSELKPLHESQQEISSDINRHREEQGVNSQIFTASLLLRDKDGLSPEEIKSKLEEGKSKIQDQFEGFLKQDGIFFKKEEIDLKISSLSEQKSFLLKNKNELTFNAKKEDKLEYLKKHLDDLRELNNRHRHLLDSLNKEWNEIIQPGLDAGMMPEMAKTQYRKDKNGNYFNISLVNDLTRFINKTEDLLLELEREEQRISELDYENNNVDSRSIGNDTIRRALNDENYNRERELIKRSIDSYEIKNN